ncbi:MAG: trypsin-like peptidase domain-containing protein [Bacteroidota bacterium]
MTLRLDILRRLLCPLAGILCLLSTQPSVGQELSISQLRRSVWEVDTPLGTCNGVLLNNTQNDGRQLLLTARHCLRDASDFVTVRLADRLLEGSDIREVSWSTINVQVLSSSVDLDYVLYEIIDPIPQELLPIYAGWNRSSVQPKSVVGWHSLLGEKLLSEDLNRPIYQTLPDFEANEATPLTNGTWRVLRWEQGFTDLGSSGSPLFNQWGDVVGILSAGGSTPEVPTNDLYTRFDLVAEEIDQYIGTDDIAYMEGTDFHRATSQVRKISAFGREDSLLSIPQVFEFSELITLPTASIQGLYLPLASAGRNDLLQIQIQDDEGNVLHQQDWSTRARLFGREHYLPVSPTVDVTAGEYEISVSTSFGVEVYRTRSAMGSIVMDGDRRTGQSLLISFLLAAETRDEDVPDFTIDPLVYPNPVSDNLYLEGIGNEVTLTLFDSKGRSIRVPSTSDAHGRRIVDFYDLPPGLYYLRQGTGETYPILHR